MGSIPGAVYNYFTTDNSYRTKPSPTPSPSSAEKKDGSWFPTIWGGPGAKNESTSKVPVRDIPGSSSSYASMFEDKKVEEFFRETDDMLDEMGDGVDRLNEMANEMNRTLDDHNRKLATLEDKVDRQNERLKKNTGKINKLL